MNARALLTLPIALLLLVIPSAASAASLSDLESQLKEVMAQVAWFQSKDGIVAGASTTTAPLTVTAPNGGEKWELGVTNSITWTPYGYNPDINPSSDVVAYLEKRVGLFYKTVGTVVPTGKASIHWETDIDTYGKYPEPGNYYIRIVNTKTGQWDRSNKAFTLTPRSVDVKVNRSNGPVELRNDQQVTLSWTTLPGFTSCSAYGVRSSLTENSYQIDNLSPNGGTMQAYYITPEGEPARSISVGCSINENVWRYDSVQVKLKEGAVRGESFVKVLSPNGGEALDPKKRLDIVYTQTGLKTVSVALYKNDQWKYWIVKDQIVEGGGKNLASFVPSEALQGLGEGDNAGAIFKIYVTGKKADDSGYTDDKSDNPFSFVLPTAPTLVSFDTKTYTTKNPTLTGTGKGLFTFGISVDNGDKVYASGNGAIPVLFGSWSHKITADLPNGNYRVQAYNTKNVLIGTGKFAVAVATTTGTSAVDTLTASVQNGSSPLTVTFTGTVNAKKSCGGGIRTLSFGDTLTYSISFPADLCSAQTFSVTHTYKNAGTYTAGMYEGAKASGTMYLPKVIQVYMAASTSGTNTTTTTNTSGTGTSGTGTSNTGGTGTSGTGTSGTSGTTNTSTGNESGGTFLKDKNAQQQMESASAYLAFLSVIQSIQAQLNELIH